MDLRKLETNLLELFTSKEHNRIDPINLFKHTASDIMSRQHEAVKMYRGDSMFAATVKCQVANVMLLVVEANNQQENRPTPLTSEIRRLRSLLEEAVLAIDTGGSISVAKDVKVSLKIEIKKVLAQQ